MKNDTFLNEINTTKPISGEAFLVFHDQLNEKFLPENVRLSKKPLLFLESFAKGDSLPYHKKKLVFVLSAQRHFALEMKEMGHEVQFLSGKGPYDELVHDFLKRNLSVSIFYNEPAEWDTRQRMSWVCEATQRMTCYPNPCFLSNTEEWKSRIANGYRMEFFYREMRRRTGLLMEDGKPVGEKWNYDEENRKSLPKKVFVPPVTKVIPDNITMDVIQMVENFFPTHPGKASDFDLPVTRTQALAHFDQFLTERLSFFGPYEDAMKTGELLLFHSSLSTLLNAGLLLPEEICLEVEKAWKEGSISLASAEGFIRQIIGWREFVRNYYEAMMPDVRNANFLQHAEGIPQFFWDGKTEMRCLKECVNQVLDNGYTHHIPRLMVLSNFATLTETDPEDVLKWFWALFTDAYEWVVLPNVLGMSTFADGGVLASKPYVASGNYINKMSDYCSGCHYNVDEKTGEKACPFNSLYWRFIHRNFALFQTNGRSSFVAQNWEKKSQIEKNDILDTAENILQKTKRYPKKPLYEGFSRSIDLS